MNTILPVTLFSRWFLRCRGNAIVRLPDRPQSLRKRQVLAVFLPGSGKIHCLGGSLWITRDGGGEDLILTTGQTLELDGGGRAVIEALEEGRFAIAEPCGV